MHRYSGLTLDALGAYFGPHAAWLSVTLAGYFITWVVLLLMGYWRDEPAADVHEEIRSGIEQRLVEPWDVLVRWWWTPVFPMGGFFAAWFVVSIICIVPALRAAGPAMLAWTWIGLPPILVYGVGPRIGIAHRMWTRQSRLAAGWCVFSGFVAVIGYGWFNWTAPAWSMVGAVLPSVVVAGISLALVGLPIWWIVRAMLGHRRARAHYDHDSRQLDALQQADPSGATLSETLYGGERE